MQIKTRTKLKDAGYNLGEGDVVTVDDEIGKAWCDAGWAEDVAGAHPSAPLVPGVAAVKAEKLTQSHAKGGVTNG